MYLTQDISPGLQLAASAALNSCRRLRIGQHLERRERLLKVRLKMLQDLVQVIGSDRYHHYRNLREATKQRLHAACARNQLIDLSAQREAKRQMLSEAQAIIQEMGLDREQISRICRAYHSEALSTLGAAVSYEPAPAFTGSAAQTSQQPPYPYAYSYSHVEKTQDCEDEVVALEDKATGNLDIKSRSKVWDAGDYSSVDIFASSGMIFFFQMPATGRLRAKLLLIARDDAFYEGWMANEWGWSDFSHLGMINVYGSTALHDEDIMGGDQHVLRILGNEAPDDVEGWHWVEVSTGDQLERTFVSDRVYQAGSMLQVEFGVSHSLYFASNDVTCNLYVNSKFRLQSVILDVQ